MQKLRKRCEKLFTLFILTLLILVAGVSAATFTVTNTNDSGAGSLRQAVLDANNAASDDVIEFDAGVFASPQTITLTSGEMLVESNGDLTINGPGANLLSISGNDASRVFNVSGTTTQLTATIKNLTLRDGFASTSNVGGGGIIVNGNGEFLVTLNIEGVTFTENSAGGGLHVFEDGILNINNSVFRNNMGSGIDCGSGGGFCVSVHINNTIFDGNIVGSGGGGGFICCGNGAPANAPITIENSLFVNNTASNNGSAFRENNFGTFTWRNVTFARNSASGSATLQLARGDHTFENVTVAYNSTTSINETGGIADVSVNGSVKFRNTIVAKNRNANGESDLDFENGTVLESLGYNIFGNLFGTTTVAGDTTGNQIGVDPLLDTVLRSNGGVTQTLALRSGSPAIDAAAPANFPATDQRGITRPVDGDGNGSALPDIGAFEKRPEDIVPLGTRFDLDGDGRTDIGIFRPAPGEWWYMRSSDNQVPAFQFGATSDTPVPADFTGDGKTDVAFFRPSSGEWFVLRSEDSSFFSFPFGQNGDIPIPGDFDGDGFADPAIFRPSIATWFILNSSGGTTTQQFGLNGDQPIVADYDGDGKDDLAIFRPSVAEWYYQRSTDTQVIGFQFGIPNDTTPVQEDYTGDGKTDIAFFRPSTNEWFVLRSEDSSFFAFPFGASGDIPVPGDYDGDGTADPAVFRPSNNTWFLNQSTSGSAAIQFGINNDVPLPSVYIP